MKFYLAPLEGITGHIYRNALEKYFPGTDRYFTPFIAPDQNKILRTKELRDILPENNRVKELIPQILTNNADHFRMTVEVLKEYGYREFNLNFGCPSGTVASKKRGSGLLAYLDELEALLDQIFEENQDVKISIKTRIGREDDEDAHRIMEIYRKYPLSELIIHPRTQKDFYRGAVRLDRFEELLGDFMPPNGASVQSGAEQPIDHVSMQSGAEQCLGSETAARRGAEIPICYNGDILSAQDYEHFTQRFPQIDAVMLGRGVIADPGLIHYLKTGEKTDKKTLRLFLDEVLEGYREVFGEDRNALFRMKEMWIYMIRLFPDGEKPMKKIRKANSLAEYQCAVDQLL
jgi:tRNA-dihydrouridine synthase